MSLQPGRRNSIQYVYYLCVDFASVKFNNQRTVVAALLVLVPLRSQVEALLVNAGVAPIEEHCGLVPG